GGLCRRIDRATNFHHPPSPIPAWSELVAVSPRSMSSPRLPLITPPTIGDQPVNLPRLVPRAPETHKGTYGHVLLVGGSIGMSGAVSLAGMAALRSGAGLVTLAVPDRSLAVVSGYEPSYMTYPLPTDPDGRIGEGALE